MPKTTEQMRADIAAVDAEVERLILSGDIQKARDAYLRKEKLISRLNRRLKRDQRETTKNL